MSLATHTVPKPAAPAFPRLLENGNRLTRAELERRYEAMPQLKKAELIEGVAARLGKSLATNQKPLR